MAFRAASHAAWPSGAAQAPAGALASTATLRGPSKAGILLGVGCYDASVEDQVVDLEERIASAFQWADLRASAHPGTGLPLARRIVKGS
jgi:hypothetical protein